jgi:hypothetical protein
MILAGTGAHPLRELCNAARALHELNPECTFPFLFGVEISSRSTCIRGLVHAAQQEFPSLHLCITLYGIQDMFKSVQSKSNIINAGKSDAKD